MKKLDCLGDMCPVPLMKLMELKPQLDMGESVMIVTDHSCTCESLLSYCKKQQFPTKVVEPISGIWEVHIFPREDTSK